LTDDKLYRLQDIARMLIDARDELESLGLTDVNALHAAISQAQWLCANICQDTPDLELRDRVAAAKKLAVARS
jgi:hypothetical protein